MVSVFTIGRGGISYKLDQIPQMGTFSFQIQSHPLASNMGNHSVGKWDPIPKCDKTRNPPAEWDVVSFFFFLKTVGIKELNSRGLLVQASHIRGRQLFATKIRKYVLENVYSYCY